MADNLLSFLCLSYNHGKYIENCLKSIWNNDYKNIEIIVLDDGSSDNSVKILHQLQTQSPFPMKVIAQENCGCIGANFNKLIKEAQGEFFSIISCDDMVIENTINQKMQELVNNKNLVYVCHSKVVGVDENGQKVDYVAPLKLDEIQNPKVEDILNLDFKEINAYYMQGSIYRRDIVDKFGGFDDDMICDDIIFRTKLSKYMLQHSDLEFKVFRTPAIYYRRHQGSVSFNSLRQVKGALQYYKRYWPDKELPKMFYEWLYSLNRTQLIELFLEDDYKIRLFNNLDENYVKSTLFYKDFPYKKQGIPFLFQVLSYKSETEKIRVIKLFNIKIYKYVKKIK